MLAYSHDNLRKEIWEEIGGNCLLGLIDVYNQC